MSDFLEGVPRDVSLVMENRTCKEIIEALIAQYDLSVNVTIASPEPAPEWPVECEECSGPCRWEYADWYGEEKSE